MANIVKHQPVFVKCSNPLINMESITCMAVESSTKKFPLSMIWIYSNTENLSRNEFMPTAQLQSTLSDTLDCFPILAGRVSQDSKGNITINLTNEGVLYTEADCLDYSLDHFVPRTTRDEDFDYEHINASDLAVKVSNDFTGPCVSIQVTRLKCNSVILSIQTFHFLFDAQSISHFINAWAAAKPPREIPMFDKSFILHSTEQQKKKLRTMTRPINCVFNRNVNLSSDSVFVGRDLQERVICKVYFFSVQELKNIKNEASKNLSKSVDYISTYDALYAHMILVIAAATQTSLSDTVMVLQSLNGRPRFVSSCSPSVLNYFGSFSFWLYGTIPCDQEPTLSSLAQFIHEMHSRQTEDSLKEYNAYLMSGDGHIDNNRVDADITNHDFHCASWRKVNMLGAKFGNSGFPVYSGPTNMLYPRYFPMMDAHPTEESINISLGLKERDYQRMMEQNMLHKYG